jgi:sec-independent protein translocase protein TatB
MFDIGASEFLLIVIVAIVVIGPKDLPRALRLAGQWIAKVRRVSGHFRSGIETMIREAELAEMEKKWREQNEEIMKAYPADTGGVPAASAEAALPAPVASEAPAEAQAKQGQPEPQLPFPPP